MSGSSPTSALRLIARWVRAEADTLRALSVRITVAAAATRWESAGAARFRDRVRERAIAMRGAANRLDAAADVIDRHAAATEAGR